MIVYKSLKFSSFVPGSFCGGAVREQDGLGCPHYRLLLPPNWFLLVQFQGVFSSSETPALFISTRGSGSRCRGARYYGVWLTGGLGLGREVPRGAIKLVYVTITWSGQRGGEGGSSPASRGTHSPAPLAHLLTSPRPPPGDPTLTLPHSPGSRSPLPLHLDGVSSSLPAHLTSYSCFRDLVSSGFLVALLTDNHGSLSRLQRHREPAIKHQGGVSPRRRG
ncbi:hypothetical protein E2C01_018721 [Portunus trituberculatus]|uniref:Uncharacterized protein n=1 Tax=Portunus trituberculatus TaxID=210409 RepID=A0A5B7DVS6_PORTR|nr:hypothetical protein [Portunus trituberculatus]